MKKIVFAMALAIILPCLVYSNTIIVSKDQNNNVLVGNNEDFKSKVNSKIWFTMANGNEYGCAFWGYDNKNVKAKDYPQGGMNEKGLFFDKTVAPYSKLEPQPGRNTCDIKTFIKIFKTSSTVDEVVSKVSKLNLVGFEECQILVADKSGDYAVIENNLITRKTVEDYFVLTKFRRSNIDLGGYPSIEFTNAIYSLNINNEASAKNFEKILDGSKNTGYNISTIYSQICNLKNGIIYLYQHHNFEHPCILNINIELKKGAHEYAFTDLFPKRVAPELIKTYYEKGIKGSLALFSKMEGNREWGFSESELCIFAKHLLMTGKYEHAFQVLNKTLSYYPESSDAYYQQAVLALYNKNEGKAKRALKRSLYINPDNKFASRLLTQLNIPKKHGKTKLHLKGYENARVVTVMMANDGWRKMHHLMRKENDGWVYYTDIEKDKIKSYVFNVDGKIIQDPQAKAKSVPADLVMK